MSRRSHHEKHQSGRASWLRAAVLGSNDAIVSTASLMLGVAESGSSSDHGVLVAGLAALVAGATSMAVGEYVSVSSQRDAEEADVRKEKHEIATAPHAEVRELVGIYMDRGLDEKLAHEVAEALMAKDALGSHLRDELGIDPNALARPWQAAFTSAASFAFWALVPIVALLAAPKSARSSIIATVSLASLGGLGALGAHLGNAPKARATVRVLVGGALAMGATAAIGRIVGGPI